MRRRWHDRVLNVCVYCPLHQSYWYACGSFLCDTLKCLCGSALRDALKFGCGDMGTSGLFVCLHIKYQSYVFVNGSLLRDAPKSICLYVNVLYDMFVCECFVSYVCM